MASAEGFSAPGAVEYSSDTMVVGDGTWDFTKNTFLLPNLAGLNFDTLQYNGMGNRFATVAQYHQLITAHGVLAAIVFCFLVPAAVMHARFYRGPPGSAIRVHAYIQIFSTLLITVVFVLGWFAVGPNRSWTNPHHAIGLTIYTMFLLQIVGGRLVKNIRKRSIRLMIHRWSGRTIALLGITQIPLGLALYGSPKATFILYAIWMGFLLLVYFILSYRREGRRDQEVLIHGGRSEVKSESPSRHGHGWIGPLAAGAGTWALLRGRKKRADNRSRSRSRSRSLSRSRRGAPEVVPSRGGSTSYVVEDEKYSDSTDRSKEGLMDRILGVVSALGAGALVKNMMDRRNRRYRDEEYSAVATDTPRRRRKHPDDYTESDISEDRTALGGKKRGPLLPGPGDPVAAAAALSAAEPRPTRPMTPPRPTHSRVDSYLTSDYSYDSPSRRPRDDSGGNIAKGILGGLGLGWLGNKMKSRRDKKADQERLRLEEERRDGRRGSKFTGDGFGTPTKSSRHRPLPTSEVTATSFTQDTGSSKVEARPPGAGHNGPPMPPLDTGGAPRPPPVVPRPGSHSRSRSRARRDSLVPGPVDMPAMPPDPAGVLSQLNRESGDESYMSAGGNPHRRYSSRQRRQEERATASAIGSQAARRSERSHSRAPSKPVSVKVKYHDDRGNVTLRRLTEEEAAASRRRRRSSSVSSLSGSEGPGRRRYRRDSGSRRAAEEAAEQTAPLSPPAPSFAGGRRQKDSAYYSGQPGQSAGLPVSSAGGMPTSSAGMPMSQLPVSQLPVSDLPVSEQPVSSIGTESHGTWSAMSLSPSQPRLERTAGPTGSVAASAEDRRRRRRFERQASKPTDATDFN